MFITLNKSSLLFTYSNQQDYCRKHPNFKNQFYIILVTINMYIVAMILIA